MNINPTSGEELQQAVDKIVSSPPNIVTMVKDAIATKDVQRKAQ